MRKLIALAGSIVLFATVASGSAAGSSTLCVDATKPGCYETVQAVLDAAHDGDTIEIAPGTFAGGITIDKSVSLVGVSAGATTIEAAGP
jgi:pectin methylesterase-like acyl-CoA thioesterase